MKQTAKRILAFVSVVCIAFIGVFTMPFVSVNAAEQTETLNVFANKGTVSGTTISWTSGNVSFVNEKGGSSTNIRTSDSDHFRVYQGNKTTISTVNEANITKIVITITESKYVTPCNNSLKAATPAPTTSTSGTVVTAVLNANSITFSATAQWRLKSIAVTYTEGGATEEPEEPESQPSITLSGDDYTQVGGTLTITAAEENLTEDVVWNSSNTDVATVAGGVVTGKAMGKATIKATANGVEATKEIKVYPVEGSELTIAEAKAVCDLTGATNPYTYSTTGTIASIDTPYDSEYGNITITITDGTDSIKAYRMKGGEELAVGAKIQVTGALVLFGTTYEFNSGCTYELLESDIDVEGITSALNAVDAYMSLGYKYTQTTDNVAVSAEVTDTLNLAFTDIDTSKSDYQDWSGKTATSTAVYAGKSAAGNSSIQLRSSKSEDGIVTTASGGKAAKVVLVWNSNSSNGRTVDVYGSNTAFTSATELYGVKADSGIKKVGSIVCGTSTELVIEGDYAYIGIRSNSGALYLDSVSITWVNEGAGSGETVEKVTFSEVDFRIKCGVNASVADIEGVDSYGIRVSAGGKTVEYTSDANSWATDDEGVSYVLLTLGDIINDVTKLTTEFTVEAYVVVDGVKFTSEKAKTYSVASLVAEYKALGYDVTHLYNHLVEIGAIKA